MTDNIKPSKGELVLSGDSSLVIIKSDLIKRGLELLHEKKKRQVKVLMADEFLKDLFTHMLEEKSSEKYDFYFVTAKTADEILELAQTIEFDIFILVLNNIIFSENNLPVINRLRKALKLVTHLKNTYSKVVLTFSGYSDINIEEKAKKAGADFYFQLPCKNEDVSEAFTICLDELSE
jgi:ActR/RegA family two-component response regulator